MGKKGLAISLATTVAVVSLAMAAGCAPQSGGGELETSAEAAGGSAAEGTMASYAQMFPLQYESSRVTTVDPTGKVDGHGVMTDIIEAPLLRTDTGAFVRGEDGSYTIAGYTYDEGSGDYKIRDLTDEELLQYGLNGGCIACKSSKFNDLYEQFGPDAVTIPMNQEIRDIINGEYFDCNSCHEGAPSADNLRPGIAYFTSVAEDMINELPEGELVCGQCHNGLAYSRDWSRFVKEDGDLEKLDPYRYGYDIDSLMQACLEDQTNGVVDEETGAFTFTTFHADIEAYQQSPHAQAGITCIDCHMPTVTDEATGQEYTTHDASGSPLENEESLEYCLTCHGAQGIGSAEQMVDFVKDVQQENAEYQVLVEDKVSRLLEGIESAMKAGTVGEEALEQAKDLYTKATWYVTWQQGQLPEPGVKAAMNNQHDVLTRAEAMCNEALSLIA